MSTGISARLLAGVAALALAVTGCSNSPEAADPNRLHRPGNDGANGDVQGMHVRNAFLLGPPSASPTASPEESPAGSPEASPTGSPTASPAASPTGSPAGGSGGQPLFAVLISDRDQPDRLEKVTVEGGGSVQLVGPVELRPGEAGSKPGQPIGMATGIRGSSVPMTFTFRDAGEVRLMVPVIPRERDFASLPPSPSGSPSPTSTPSPDQSGTTPKPTGPVEPPTMSPDE